MRICIFAPYLDICGGGEKYVGKIAEVLASENTVDFLVTKEPDKHALEDRLGLKFENINFIVTGTSSIFLTKRNISFSRLTKGYDLFINQEHFSSISSKAKYGISIQEVPPTRFNFPRYNAIHNILLDPNLKTYNKIVSNSNFTKEWVDNWYGRTVEVLYPPVETERFIPLEKRNFILSVGRFFVGDHCKRQLELIRVYKALNSTFLRDWELHLVGSAEDTAENLEYVERCQKEARGQSIHFHLNASLTELVDLCGKSKIFWCMTGLGADPKVHPDKMEHFGISTVEAMSAGCVPIVINRGGQPEIVRDNIEGFCWGSVEDLRNRTIELAKNEDLLTNMSKLSVERSKYFGMDVFERRVKELFSFAAVSEFSCRLDAPEISSSDLCFS